MGQSLQYSISIPAYSNGGIIDLMLSNNQIIIPIELIISFVQPSIPTNNKYYTYLGF